MAGRAGQGVRGRPGRGRLAALLAAVALVVAGCSDDPDPQARATRSATASPSPTESRSDSPTPSRSPSATATPRASSPSPTPTRQRAGGAGADAGVTYAVLDVVDGDTVRTAYAGGESVRVIGIDTPETVHPSVPTECGGPAASAAARRLLSGRRVRLVFDPTQGRRDTYGRVLAYVEVPGVGDFGLTMIRRGHAAEYTYDTAYRRQGAYQRAESAARAANRGVWGHCGGTDTPLKRSRSGGGSGGSGSPGGSGGKCAPGYTPCVPPYPPDVDCADVNGPVRVTGDDPHGLDGDGDGTACE